MESVSYLMESDVESQRLDKKTDRESVRDQAGWAGIKKGDRVADVGCGIGKTSMYLHEMVQSGGETVGIDGSLGRIEYAQDNFSRKGLSFACRDFRESLEDLGLFDFIWVRFVLEYHRAAAFDIVKNLTKILKPGGTICLIDLDHNCLNHYGAPIRLEKALNNIMALVENNADFDPYTGRKLYSYLYDLEYKSIDVKMLPHHLIYGEINEVDEFNFVKKVEIAIQKSNYSFSEYQGGSAEFFDEFKAYIKDPRRFLYTPLMICRGVK